eukprot:scaffold22630_cov29-Tisochrysis_lutea.AAC.8
MVKVLMKKHSVKRTPRMGRRTVEAASEAKSTQIGMSRATSSPSVQRERSVAMMHHDMLRRASQAREVSCARSRRTNGRSTSRRRWRRYHIWMRSAARTAQSNAVRAERRRTAA